MIDDHWSSAYFTQPILAVTACKEALQHRVDLIELADHEKWICKQFSAQTWLGTVTQARLACTQVFADAVAYALDLTSPAYRDQAQHAVLAINGHFGLIVPYCEGEILSTVNQTQAFILGKQLAQLHAFNFSGQPRQGFPAISLPKQIKRARWLDELIVHCNHYRHYEADKWVMSHRDVHVNNIIWPNKTKPHWIDWESAGYIHPLVELIGLAENCAGMAQSHFNGIVFRAVLQGYAESAGVLPKMDGILWELTSHSWLLWFAYCLKQGLTKEAEKALQAIECIRATRVEMRQIYDTVS